MDLHIDDDPSVMKNGGECCDFGHFHLHVFPRVKGDGFGWTYPEQGGQYADEIILAELF